MSPLSRDPERRVRQLQNLRRGGNPAPAGNARARTHGGYGAIAARDLDAKRAEVYDALSADAPLRDPDGGLPRHDSLAVRLLAEVLCRLDSVSDYLDRRGWQEADGSPRPAVEVERRLRAECLDLARELGLTPKSRAALGVDLVRAAASASDEAEQAAARARLDARLADLDGTAEEESS